MPVPEASAFVEQPRFTLSDRSATTAPIGPTAVPPLYRHGVVIELEGDYLPLLDYLQALENLPWRLYWYGLDVKADKPGARRFRLEFYTVSLHKEWIRA